MKTTQVIYWVIWLLIVLPLVLFNIRKILVKEPLQKLKIRWKTFVIVLVCIILSSVFLFSAYRVTITTRYEIAAERVITAHAKYLLGSYDYNGFKAELQEQSSEQYQNTIKEEDFFTGKAQTVRFQIGDWIIPKYYTDKDVLPSTTVLNNENPVYIFYLLEHDGKRDYYYMRLVRQENHSWRVDAHSPASEEQLDTYRKNLPSTESGKWFTVKNKDA